MGAAQGAQRQQANFDIHLGNGVHIGPFDTQNAEEFTGQIRDELARLGQEQLCFVRISIYADRNFRPREQDIRAFLIKCYPLAELNPRQNQAMVQIKTPHNIDFVTDRWFYEELRGLLALNGCLLSAEHCRITVDATMQQNPLYPGEPDEEEEDVVINVDDEEEEEEEEEPEVVPARQHPRNQNQNRPIEPNNNNLADIVIQQQQVNVDPRHRQDLREGYKMLIYGGYIVTGLGQLDEREKHPLVNTEYYDEETRGVKATVTDLPDGYPLDENHFVKIVPMRVKLHVQVIDKRARGNRPMTMFIFPHKNYIIRAVVVATETSFMVIAQNVLTTQIETTFVLDIHNRVKTRWNFSAEFFNRGSTAQFISPFRMLIVRSLVHTLPRAVIYDAIGTSETDVHLRYAFPSDELQSTRLDNGDVFVTDGKLATIFVNDENRFPALYNLRRNPTIGFSVGKLPYGSVLITGGCITPFFQIRPAEYEYQNEVFNTASKTSTLHVSRMARLYGKMQITKVETS